MNLKHGQNNVERIPLTTERKTYTLYGENVPDGGVTSMNFQWADQLETFYVKILSITEVTP